MDRPLTYTPELAEKILQRIMDGEMLTRICGEEEMPTWQTYYRWMNGRPDLKEAHARARLAWADYWAEKVMTISLDRTGDIFIEEGKAVADHARIQRDKLITDNAKWLVGKYAPRTYGDKPQDDAGEPKKLEISWQIERNIVRPDDSHPKRYESPRQIEYRKPELPADLSEQDWSVILEVLELVKRTIPSDSDRPAEEVFGVMRKALLAHFAEVVDSK
jgi:hypothetical protein